MGKMEINIPLPEQELTRKQLRKEQRQLKKVGRSRFFEAKLKRRKEIFAKKNINVRNRKSDDTVNKELPQSSKEEIYSKPKKKDLSLLSLGSNSERKNHENLLDKMKMQRKRQLVDANKDEDKEIRYLEKKLKLATKKSVSSSKAFVESGLDYILDVCDSEKIHSALKSEVNFDDSDSDFYDDISLVQSGKTKGIVSESNKTKNASFRTIAGNTVNSSARNETSDKSVDCLSDITEISHSSVENSEFSMEGSFAKDVDSSRPLDDDDLAEDGVEERESSSVACSTKQKIWEDIYGRLRDHQGNILKENDSKYIPPALRNCESTDEDKKKKELLHKVKGLLNRLALHNIHSISNQTEDLYSRNSRHAMNETLYTLYIDSLITPVLAPERLIIDHAMLIAVLSANIGSEVGAFMLQNFVQKFNSLFLYSQTVENKILDNLVYLISHLYSFKLFESVLMYDILNKLASQLTEKNVDLILIILKSVGVFLRKDDPMAMKSFLLNVQRQMSTTSGVEDHSRMRYMLDILLSIKNNNISKLPGFDPEHHEHLKKVLKSVIRNGNSNEALRIGLEDLLKAEERGRWWIVGSAWNKDGEEIPKSKKYILPKEQFSAQLLALARKQKMNTDNRRNIFCILMSAEDYHDAFEKVLKLGLKGQQEREIPSVIIHCLLQENNYNPYYAHIADQLSISNRRHQMALQCALWDRFRALEKLSVTQINSLAKFLSQLILAGSIPISVLKVVEFTELDKPHIRLLRQTILSLANVEGKESLDHIFQKVSKSKKLSLFKEALRLFLHHFILRNMPSGELKDRVSLISTLLVGETD